VRLPVSLPDANGTAWQRFRRTPIWWIFGVALISFEGLCGVWRDGPISWSMVKSILWAAPLSIIIGVLIIAARWLRVRLRFPLSSHH
jgi:hypothetical protein